MTFDTNLMYDFTIDYSVEDFKTLLEGAAGFRDNDALFEAALMLFYDYEDGRCNAFSYLCNLDNLKARVIMELRKSSILRLPRDFFKNHPSDSFEQIKRYRIDFLGKYMEDYQDENWQYWWAVKCFLPKENCESLEWRYEMLLEDGNPSLDDFENPAKVLARKIVYSK